MRGIKLTIKCRVFSMCKSSYFCARRLILVCLIKCGMWEKTKVGGGEKKLIVIGCGKSAGECHCVDRNRDGR